MTAVPVAPEPTEGPGDTSSVFKTTISSWSLTSSGEEPSTTEWTSSAFTYETTPFSSSSTDGVISTTLPTTDFSSTWSFSTTAFATPTPTPLPPAKEIEFDAWALLILLGLLLITLLSAYALRRYNIRWIHETVLSVVLGLVVGLVIRLAPGDTIQNLIIFDPRYFFNLLLPPILLNSGYEMQLNQFFKNLGTIVVFSFLGTLTSSMVVAVFIYLFALTGIHHLALSFLDCFVMGAILSSTDPVTVLAMFHQLKVDPKLYAIIFGESVLNDSVAIVLFSTLDTFRNSALSFSTFAQGSGLFVAVFTGSVLIGLVTGLLSALLFKHTRIYLFPPLESCILTIIAYCSYLLANGLQLSGIVSLLFCGISMRHYAYPNLAAQGRRTTRYMFRVLSTMSENFIFISLGITVFAGKDGYLPGLVIYTLIVLLFARWISVIPFAQLINRFGTSSRLPESPTAPAASSRSLLASIFSASPTSPTSLQSGPRVPIPRSYQNMMVVAGLRGAIAFALAFQLSATEESTEAAMRSTTLAVCVVSVLVLGSLVVPAIGWFGIRTGVESGNGGESSDEEETGPMGGSGRDGDTEEDEALMAGETGVPGRNRHWFVDFDERWLMPFFRVRYRRGGHEGENEVVTDAMPTSTGVSGSRRRFGRGDTVGNGSGARVTVTAAAPPTRRPTRKLSAENEDGDEDFVDASGNAFFGGRAAGPPARVTSGDSSGGSDRSALMGNDAEDPMAQETSSGQLTARAGQSLFNAPRLVGGIIDLNLGGRSKGNPLTTSSATPESEIDSWSRPRISEEEGFGLFQSGDELRSREQRGPTFGGLGDL